MTILMVLMDVSSHDGVQLSNISYKLLLVVCLVQPLLELLGLPLQAGQHNEGGHHQHHCPHTEEDHWHIPHIVSRSDMINYQVLLGRNWN